MKHPRNIALLGAFLCLTSIWAETTKTKVVESGGMAALNTAVDVGLDVAGDVVKGVGDLGDDTVATVFKTAVSSEAAADAAKAGVSDLAKEGVEKLVKTDSDD